MGQRLVINILHKDKVVCNAYYHWSGYTDSALEMINSIELERFNELYGDMRPIIAGINMLLKTGASFGKNRNDGLIEVDQYGIDNNLRWSEMTVDIDLDEKTVDFSQCFSCATEYDYEHKTIQERCELDVDYWIVPFDNIEKFTLPIINSVRNHNNVCPTFYCKHIDNYIEPSVW